MRPCQNRLGGPCYQQHVEHERYPIDHLGEALHAKTARKGYGERLERESQLLADGRNALVVGWEQEQVDVLRGSRRAMNGQCHTATECILDPVGIECSGQLYELVEEVHVPLG